MYTIKGNKLIIHNTWQMTIPNECHVNCIPQGTARHIQIMNGSQSLIDMYIADKKANQSLTQILSLEMLKSIKEECRPLSVSKYRDDALRVRQITGYHLEDHCFLSIISIETEDEEHYSMMAWLPVLDDEQHENFLEFLDGNGYSGNGHPCGYRWQQSWRMIQQMAFSIAIVDEEMEPSDSFYIDGTAYPLSMPNEVIRGLSFRMPQCLDKLHSDENKWLYLYNPDALTEKQLRADADTIKLACEIDYSSTSHGDEMQSALQRNDDDSFDFVLTGLFLSLNRVSVFGSIQAKQLSGSRYKYLFLDAPGSEGNMQASIYVSLHHGDIALLRIKCLDESLSSPRTLAQSARCVYDSIDLSEDELRLPRTTASDFQIEHLNALTPKVERRGNALFNWMPQHNGADFEPKSIRELLENDGLHLNRVYWHIRHFLKNDSYTLDDTARKMAEVFHVPEDEFDSTCDREAFIHMGIISHAYKFSALRSLAWILAEQAYQQQRELGSFSFAELQRIGEYVEENEWRCYSAMSHFPGLCDHADYHVFYLPDRLLLETDDMELAEELLCDGKQREMESLEALRHDLAALKPVMEIICNTPGCNLQGPLADALEAWCALCVAAREPFFSEDGQFGYRLETPGSQRPYGEFDAAEDGEWDQIDDADDEADEEVADEADAEVNEDDEDEVIDHAALRRQLIEVGFLVD